MTPTMAVPLRFGRFELRPNQRELRIDGHPAKLGTRAFDILAVLAARRERTVSKHELLDLVWPDLVVEENNLQVHVSALRKLLGPSSIATIPGRGYRFTAAVAESTPSRETGDAGPAGSAARDDDGDAGADSRAVLPPRRRLASVGATLHNLPAASPPLHGRVADLTSLLVLLGTHRLVTVAGAGGIGKTRLAQAAAAAAVSDYRDGAWLVELAPLSEPGLVLDSVARTLGVPLPLTGGAEGLAARVADRRLLLVLDNCEHLLDAVSGLADALLRGTEGVSVLATSQHSLRLPDEHVLRLGTLPVPDAAAAPETASPEDGDALTLFEERARAVQPRFALTAATRGAALDICRQLDGIPLAIELAAARLPLLGLEGLRQRLDDRFRVLTSGTRLAPARQQTLRAALEWSHAHLSADEQAIFRRLGVFQGSFGLDASQAVAAGEGLDAWDVLEGLGALVDKSLVLAEPGEIPRYRLFETPRAFALDRLADAGEARATRHRHAEAMHATWTRGDDVRWLPGRTDEAAARLDDLDNLRAALSWTASPEGNRALHVELVVASSWFWQPALLEAEGERVCRQALACLGPDTPPEREATLLLAFARLSHQHDAAGELAALGRAAGLFREVGDLQGAFAALALRARKLVWRFEPQATERAIADAASSWSSDWPPLLQGPLMQARAYACEALDRPEDGQPMLEEIVALARRLGDEDQLTRALADLAENLFVQGKDEETLAARFEIARRCEGQDSLESHLNNANLVAAIAHAGRTDEGIALARWITPAMNRIDRLDMHLVHWALLALQDGRPRDAALAIGCSDAAVKASGFGREMAEQRTWSRVMASLEAAMPAAEVAKAIEEGESLTALEAAARALA